MNAKPEKTSTAYKALVVIACTALLACSQQEQRISPEFTEVQQIGLDARAVQLVEVDNLQFKDMNKNGILDNYEDWRLPVSERVEDLVSQMTLEEKVGMMMIDTLNADFGGGMTDDAEGLIKNEKMTRFRIRLSNPPNALLNGHAGR